MVYENSLFGVDPARLLFVGARISVDKPRTEFVDGRNLFPYFLLGFEKDNG